MLVEMRREHETRFVENKTSLGRDDGAFNFAKAVASFANTLGGWVLIGLDDAGEFVTWDAPEAHGMTDRVRQALEREIDPMPPFAATVCELDGHPLGVVRVYASIDAPHVMQKNGAVFLREVAKDRNAAKAGRFEARPVTAQGVLQELFLRAEVARQRADALLQEPHLTPVIARACGLQLIGRHWSSSEGGATIRAVPLMRQQMADWAVSHRGHAALTNALAGLVGSGGFVPTQPEPAASGLLLQGTGSFRFPGPIPLREVGAVAAADAAGIVVMKVRWGQVTPAPPTEPLTLQYFRDGLIAPLLEQTVSLLEGGEFFGRVLLRLELDRLGDIAQLIEADEIRLPPGALPVAGELALPGALETRNGSSPVDQLADQWRDDLGRAAGYVRLRD